MDPFYKKKFLFLLAGLILFIPFDITSWVLAGNNFACDHQGFQFTIQDYMVGAPIISTCAYIFIFIALFIEMKTQNMDPGFHNIIHKIFQALIGLFMFAWFVVGAVILFHYNLDCIRSQIEVKYATFYWAYTIITLIVGTIIWSYNHKKNTNVISNT
ncbi:MAG: hypothetical protein Terrestrivirus2_24 [Terrestrivirus sp.]|jgi:hypothetical protein|uniref:Transmembrane protein n=1 Tax=Terrestrivirus sp. TaxID=2487775 RepID=A0A3G4ZL05_9VIRU|nr:MAG: hypothetical protein Terrestrivirus2_24 [Terrestrivirus sp.]